MIRRRAALHLLWDDTRAPPHPAGLSEIQTRFIVASAVTFVSAAGSPEAAASPGLHDCNLGLFQASPADGLAQASAPGAAAGDG
jgi:hypothetical protein